jgi:hypothetical protein
MKPLFIALIILIGMASCGKSDKNDDTPEYPPRVKEAGEYRATNFLLDAESILSPNVYLHEFTAGERRDVTSFSTYLTEPRRTYLSLRDYSEGLYGLRYIGNCKLLDPNKIYKVAGEMALYALNDSLLGKPVFEIYEIATNKTYQRFIASADSCAVLIYRGPWTSDIPMDTAGFRNAYNTLVETGLSGKIFEGL